MSSGGSRMVSLAAIILMAVLLVQFCATSTARAQNTVGNPSFETPQGAAGTEIGGGAGTSWSTFNAVFLENQNPGPAEDGNQYIKVFGGGSGAFQDIPVVPGEPYTAMSWARLPSADHAAAGQSQFGQLLVIFRNPSNTGQVGATQADNTVHFGTGGVDSPSDTWLNSTLTGTVPAGVGFIRLQLNEGASAGGAVWFDNASLVLPEPASIGLLAFGGIALMRRR